MKQRLWYFLFCFVCLGFVLCNMCLISVYLAAQESESAPTETGPSFENFELIWQRNIFDPSRRKQVEEPVVRAPEPVVYEFSLLGTLVTENNSYAFFEGNRSSLSGVVKQGESFEPFIVQAISTTSIQLVSGEENIPLKIGMTLRREEEQDWNVIDSESVGPSSGRSSDDSRPLASKSEEHDEETVDEDSNDVLKRLMEQRKQELNQ